jgi:organic radical activating enzyme
MTAEEVTTEVSALPIHDNGLVVITGGEPFRQPGGLRALVECLIDKGFYIQIETNGTLPPPDGIGFLLRRTVTSIAGDTRGVYIVCSPKTGKVHQHTEARSCCFKYVLDHENINPDDGLPIRALKHTANPQLARPMKGRDGGWSLPIYVQPADVQDEYQNGLNRAAAVKSCLDFGYTLQLQIHKTLELE